MFFWNIFQEKNLKKADFEFGYMINLHCKIIKLLQLTRFESLKVYPSKNDIFVEYNVGLLCGSCPFLPKSIFFCPRWFQNLDF